MSDVNPYEKNPYASPEEPKAVFDYHRSSGSREPALPLHMTLWHKTGLFWSQPCEMSVWEDRMTISGKHLDASITIPRDVAHDQVTPRLLDMIIRKDSGRKFRMGYPKGDPDRNLTLARLETWMDWLVADDPEAAEKRVVENLKKWACSMVLHYISWILVLLMIFWGIFFIACMVWDNGNVMTPLLGVLGLPVFINVVFWIFLRGGGMWILYVIILFYSLLFLTGLASRNPIIILFSGAVVYHSGRALSGFAYCRPMVRELRM